MGFVRSLLLLVAPAAAVFLQQGAELQARTWLKAHGASPSSDQLEALKETDPNSYALVQNMLSSPEVVFSLEHSEARAMDAPTKRLAPRAGVFAGLQADVVQPRREGLVELPAFARTVENAAGIAEDNSKLQHDFGDAAVAPQARAITELNQQETVPADKSSNPLVEEAAQYTQQN
eukprot:gnl/MRDRNA2_/MRDRNA2_129750_c0_seq1.p1 gnl/MRDRNA2_/MRDRNA2_129750_c0~~gnl/MRDRNA2_/MRDRNA2_129750_c0_seq1.p1  ORF type:complete len:176 (+),score=53.11 gnl/MRDRNA2_/MRDRNA2_129750_c0_seq1:74-601(+)